MRFSHYGKVSLRCKVCLQNPNLETIFPSLECHTFQCIITPQFQEYNEVLINIDSNCDLWPDGMEWVTCRPKYYLDIVAKRKQNSS